MTNALGDNHKNVMIEMKLCVNQRLYEKGYITAEMYEKAKSLIIRSGG